VVGARKYSIPRQIAVPRPDGSARREMYWRKKAFFATINRVFARSGDFTNLSGGLVRNLFLAPAVLVNLEKQLFFNFFHRLFFYCFLNSFN
jgi:hypothetical protein